MLQSCGKLVSMGVQNSFSVPADTLTFNLADRGHLLVPGSDRPKLLIDHYVAENEFC